jgi:N utilization substance protein A
MIALSVSSVRKRAFFIKYTMFDLKVINSVLGELEEDRGIPREKIVEAIGSALATAYKREYGKKGQIVRANFDLATGKTEFNQVKIVVDESRVRMEDNPEEELKDDDRVRFNPEHHILIADARKIKKDAELDDEIIFPLEPKGDFGRIAAQTAKQVIIQKIREAEKVSVVAEFGKREGDIVTGTVQRVERGNIYIDLGRATGILPYEEQIPGERYKQAERVRAYLYSVDENPRGVFLRLSRSHPKFLAKLFELETPEIANAVVEIKAIAREPGSRSKVAVYSKDAHIDPVGSLVGQRGVRVSTVMSELSGEKIDVIEWSEDPKKFIEDSLSPAKVMSVELDEENRQAHVTVSEDQQSLAIGKGGQNVRLAAKLTGWRIDIASLKGENVASSDTENKEEGGGGKK